MWAREKSVKAEKRDRNAERERERDVSASTPSSAAIIIITRQQHLHPSHNLQSPLSYVHSYSRTTSFLSLYYMYFAPLPHPSSKCTSCHTQVPCPTTNCTHTAQLRSDWWWRWRRNVSFSLSAFLSLFSAFTLFSRAHIGSVYSLCTCVSVHTKYHPASHFVDRAELEWRVANQNGFIEFCQIHYAHGPQLPMGVLVVLCAIHQWTNLSSKRQQKKKNYYYLMAGLDTWLRLLKCEPGFGLIWTVYDEPFKLPKCIF